MIKNYKQYINEDIKGKKIYTEVTCTNLKKKYPKIQVMYNDDFKIVISYTELHLNRYFYDMLEKDGINKDDIVFENCDVISLWLITEFTKISDYGTFRNGITNFNCSYCDNLTSLIGAPKEVTGWFDCQDSKNLTSLKGAPIIVGGDFWCHYCTNLINLDGAPNKVGGDFKCHNCKNLTSLEGSPKEVHNFICSNCNNLTSIDGAPEIIGRNFDCRNCNPDFIELAKVKYGNSIRS